MNPLPSIPENPEQDPAYHRTLLHALAGRAAEMAARLHELTMQAASPESPLAPKQQMEALAEASIPYDRYVRAVRRTVALVEQLANQRAAAQIHAAKPAKPPPYTPARARLRHAILAVLAERDPADTEPLLSRIAERLEDLDLDHGIDDCPIELVLAEVCQDLGIEIPANPHTCKQPAENPLPNTPAPPLRLVPNRTRPYPPDTP